MSNTLDKSWVQRALLTIERVGNRLPHPTVCFMWLCLFVVLLSAVGTFFGWGAVHPVSGEVIQSNNLLSGVGLRQMMTTMVSNFMNFAPLGPVLIAMLGLGIAERSGLLDLALTTFVIATRGRCLSFVVVFAGVLSSVAADAGYVVLIPLAAVVFQAAGRSPLAGIAAAFMGVSGGFSANLILGPVDVVLAGLSTEAAQLYQSGYEVSVAANYCFMVVSTFLLALIGWWVTDHWVEPFLTTSKSETSSPTVPLEVSHEQRRGLRFAGLALVLCIGFWVSMSLPATAPLRDPDSGSLMKSPLVSSIAVVIALTFAVTGIAYGRGARTLVHAEDWVKAMEQTMVTMSGYLVLMFFAAQFVSFFNWTGLGLIAAINGAQWLAGLDVHHAFLLMLLLILVACVNLCIGSASAKWALIAPIFVPMFMVLGLDPEWTQLAYRIGDSVTNIITPLMPYFALVVAYMQRYDKSAGVGTLMTMMLPYSVSLIVIWGALLFCWYWFGLPIGPSIN